MKVLFLSSLCSINEYTRMFKKYGTTSSHASQKFNRLLVDGLLQNGCTVDALTERIILNSNDLILSSFTEEENGIFYTYLKKYRNPKVNRVMTIFNTFKFIKKWTKKNPEGIIICDIVLGELSLAIWLISKIKKIKTTALVTDVPSIRAGELRTGIKAIPIKIKNACIKSYSSYIFLTEQMNSYLNTFNKPYVIIEGIVDETVLNTPNLIEKKYEKKVIMMAGLLEDVFGVSMLLEAFKNINCKDVQLKFYGRGASVEKIKKAAIEDSRISYCGELTNKEIVKEEKKATLLINPRPAIGEWTAYSFPSKNMEYMSSGTPLVAFDLPCIPKEYKEYFYKLSNYSSEEIAKDLEKLIKKNRMDLHKFGIKTQKWIVNHKNSYVQIKKYVNIIKNIK